MKAATRRTLEMGSRVLAFSLARLDSSPGYKAALDRLEERLKRADQLAEQQRIGISDVRSATQQKQRLRKQIRRSHLRHLAAAADAATDMPELATKFALPPVTTPYMVFRTSAGGILAEAQSHKETLVKRGLADTVLDSMAQSLAQFDQAVERGTSGRRAHVGASAELDVIAEDVGQVVKVMDGLNRTRFAEDRESLAAWASVSNTFGPVRSSGEKPTLPKETPPSGGESGKAA